MKGKIFTAVLSMLIGGLCSCFAHKLRSDSVNQAVQTAVRHGYSCEIDMNKKAQPMSIKLNPTPYTIMKNNNDDIYLIFWMYSRLKKLKQINYQQPMPSQNTQSIQKIEYT